MPKLKIDINADSKGVDKGVKESKSKFGKLFNDLKTGMGTVFGAAGSMFTVAAITRAFSGIIDKMDLIGKSARALGMTSEGYQKIFYAARRANMPQDRLNMSFQRMANFLHAANQKTSKQRDILGRLGLEYEALIRMKPDEQFIAIGKEIDNVANATERLAFANKIYGRGARDVLNMVRGYEGMASELQAKGGIISDEDIQAAEEFKDQWETFKTRAVAAATKGGLIQLLNQTAETLNGTIDRIQKQVSGKGAMGLLAFAGEESGFTGGERGGFGTELKRMLKAQLWVLSAGLFGGKSGGILGSAFTDYHEEQIKKLYGDPANQKNIEAGKRRLEELKAGPQALGADLPLGGRLAKPSADIFHQIGGYLTPGQFEAGRSPAYDVLENSSKFDQMMRLVAEIPDSMLPTMDEVVNGTGASAGN